MVCRSVGRSTTRRQWNFVDQTKRAQTVETYDAQCAMMLSGATGQRTQRALAHTHTLGNSF